MYSFIARQPIFDKDMKTVAYELLFRDGLSNSFPMVSSEIATMQVISDQFLSIPSSKIVGEHVSYINFPYQMLISGLADSLPKDNVVIEILECAVPDDHLFNSVLHLYNLGYKLALDDFTPDSSWKRFLPYISIIKFDIQQTSSEVIKSFMYENHSNSEGLIYLAEKIETYDEFKICKELGFSLFQGYFYSRPELIKNKRLSQNVLFLNQLMIEVNAENPDFTKIESILSHDLSLSYKIMRYAKNIMSRFGTSESVTGLSLKEMALYLGKNELSRFVSVLCMTTAGTTRVNELYQTSLIRAKFCESIANSKNNQKMSQNAFYCGLFSMLDAILETPFETLFSQIELSREVRLALLNNEGVLFQYLNLTISYEKQDWPQINAIIKDLGLTETEVIAAMRSAVDWANDYHAL